MSWGWNVPDDWDMYWRVCPYCDSRYHASEGDCDCEQVEEEERQDEVRRRLIDRSTVIEAVEVERCIGSYAGMDDVGLALRVGDRMYRVYILDAEGADEVILSTVAWDSLCKLRSMNGACVPEEE